MTGYLPARGFGGHVASDAARGREHRPRLLQSEVTRDARNMSSSPDRAAPFLASLLVHGYPRSRAEAAETTHAIPPHVPEVRTIARR